MGLLADLGIEPGQVKSSDLDDWEKSGGKLPAGVYHAELKGAAGPNDKINGWKLRFVVIAGPMTGNEITETLWNPKGQDAQRDKSSRNRQLLFASRLGLLARDAAGNLSEVPGKSDFRDCLGATCFIDVVYPPERDTDGNVIKKPSGEPVLKQWPELAFKGLIDPADERCKDVPKRDPAAAPRAAAVRPPKDEFGDI